MIFKHKKSGVLYRMLFPAFNVETQRQCIIYMSMETGVVFSKDAERFHAGMEYVSQPQEDIEPNPNQAEFKFDDEHS